MRALTLDVLLFASLFESGPRRSIFTDRLLENLAAHGLEAPPKQAFRSDVIGGLRDRGIVSCQERARAIDWQFRLKISRIISPTPEA